MSKNIAQYNSSTITLEHLTLLSPPLEEGDGVEGWTREFCLAEVMTNVSLPVRDIVVFELFSRKLRAPVVVSFISLTCACSRAVSSELLMTVGAPTELRR